MSNRHDYRIVAVGASAGGVSAIRRLISHLTSRFELPLVVVQHLPPTARVDVGLIYGSRTERRVLEAEDKMTIEPRIVYMASPAYHLLTETDGTLSLSQDEPVNYSRPAIDVLFESVARAFGRTAIGVLLTGANSDGASGLKRIQEAGGLTLVQSPDEAESPAMPKSALALLEPDFVGSVEQIAEWLNSLVREEARV